MFRATSPAEPQVRKRYINETPKKTSKRPLFLQVSTWPNNSLIFRNS